MLVNKTAIKTIAIIKFDLDLYIWKQNKSC